MATVNITVPDLGGAENLEIIEISVAVGDEVEAQASLLCLESDKSTMDIPAPEAGTIVELKVQLGDKVSEGTLIAVLEQADIVKPEALATQPVVKAAVTSEVATPASSVTGAAIECDLVVVGAGPGGYSAAFRAADLGLKVVLVERYGTLGGVCLNVGCIPSKALLHVAAVMREAQHISSSGVEFGAPKVDADRLRGHKDSVVANLTGGLAAMAKMRKVQRLQGIAQFHGANHVRVEGNGEARLVSFKRAIIATGSRPVKLPFLPEDDRIVDSTGALGLKSIPERMLIIGGGIIGLEMGTVYSALGTEVDVVEMLDEMMPGADTDLVKVWRKSNKDRFSRLMTKTSVTKAEVVDEGIRVTFEGDNAPSDTCIYDLVLESAGRRPNSDLLALEAAGIAIDERGFIAVDDQMRTNIATIFAVGDIVGQPMLAHKAVHEAHIAAEVVAGELLGDDSLSRQAYDATVIPAVAYTDPEVAWAGLNESQAKESGRDVEIGVFPWSASGRALANGQSQGFTKLLFDVDTKRIIGGGIVGAHAGDLIGEVALAIEMGADAVDLGKTIHPHPTLIETLSFAAEVAEGVCTDLPPSTRH
ncbi:dihydrolipoyl dehydrogenase [Pseudomaricurvus alcaniphilus]|uniref:dihydrolipoyl dehydrogenase n=1 Tax=Pseudomaricurvus alcaniphilus TaxID=1166482 RepID=UPI001409A2AD|nr:dihydrolipoyl dehydrogenase [Pseudomaricurvus alcaniphilus]